MKSDWFPGGRYGTDKNYREGYERIFGKQDTFKNLAKDNRDDNSRSSSKTPKE